MAIYLSNKSFLHKSSESEYFVHNCVTKIVFQALVSNNKVAKISITGKNQFQILRQMSSIKPDITCENKVTICF